jgi:hypothetical protein
VSNSAPPAQPVSGVAVAPIATKEMVKEAEPGRGLITARRMFHSDAYVQQRTMGVPCFKTNTPDEASVGARRRPSDTVDCGCAYFRAFGSGIVYPGYSAMSIFSKLFPGGVKGEGDTLPTAAPSTDLAEGSTMKRPPNDAKLASAVRPDPDAQKTASTSMPRGSGMRAQAVVQARPAGPVPSSGRPAPTAAPVRGRSSPPRALREESVATVAQASSSNAGSPGSYVAVSASRLQGPASSPAPAPAPAPAPKAEDAPFSGAARRSRPEIPAVSIGASGRSQASPPPPASPHSEGRIVAAAAQPRVLAEPAKVLSRPPPAEVERSNGGSIADTFERLLSSELEAGFASMQQPAGSASARAAAGADLGEVRSLFAQLAANHVRCVRDFVIDLRWSGATVEWVSICSPALQSLRRAAEKLELGELCRALDKFSEGLSAAQSDPGHTIGGERRAAILACYDELSRLMPQAFAIDMDQTQRESVILQSLLLQVPDVKKVTLDKMYAAGLSTLEAMLLATPEDIVATTGVAELTAQRIVERFRAYRAHVTATAPDAARTRERQHIADLTARLKREHDAYERTCQAWSREAAEQKKDLRKVRAQTLLDIQVELARLGEVERLNQIERLPFGAKLTELESFLEDARDKYIVQP